MKTRSIVKEITIVEADTPISVKATEGFGHISKRFPVDMMIVDSVDGDRVVVPLADMRSIFERGGDSGVYFYNEPEPERETSRPKKIGVNAELPRGA